MTSNEAGRLTAADRTEITDLYARYALAIDFGDGADWAKCFTPDGTFTAHRGEGTESRRIEGHADLDSFARQHRASQNGGTRHHFTNVALSPAPGGAIGRASIFYAEGKSVLGSGLYEDILVRESGRWLFRSRVVTHDRLRP